MAAGMAPSGSDDTLATWVQIAENDAVPACVLASLPTFGTLTDNLQVGITVAVTKSFAAVALPEARAMARHEKIRGEMRIK